MRESSIIVIDGNNIVNHRLIRGQTGCLQNLLLVLEYLQGEKFTPIILVSAKLKYYIDDPRSLEDLLEQGSIMETPAGSDSDLFILETAKMLDAYIFSNDLFRQYNQAYGNVIDHRIPFLIINDRIISPTLQYILSAEITKQQEKIPCLLS
jgi:hypothetical protein